jgi:hypothetical protein
MIRRRRKQDQIAPTGEDGAAPHTDYADDESGVLTLRWALPARSRMLYERIRSATSGDELRDRGAEFLFRRLAVRWEVGGAVVRGRTALIERYKVASESQRAFVLAALRAHAAEHYPELEGP